MVIISSITSTQYTIHIFVGVRSIHLSNECFVPTDFHMFCIDSQSNETLTPRKKKVSVFSCRQHCSKFRQFWCSCAEIECNSICCNQQIWLSHITNVYCMSQTRHACMTTVIIGDILSEVCPFLSWSVPFFDHACCLLQIRPNLWSLSGVMKNVMSLNSKFITWKKFDLNWLLRHLFSALVDLWGAHQKNVCPAKLYPPCPTQIT